MLQILSSMLKYVCFTLISTFNLTASATGTTGRDGRKTAMFYRLVDWSLVVLLCWFWNIKKFLISCSDLCISVTVTIGCSGHELLSLDRFFCFLVAFAMFAFAVGW